MQKKLLLIPLISLLLVPAALGAEDSGLKAVQDQLDALTILVQENTYTINSIEENSLENEFEWVITSWIDADNRGTPYINIQVENVWPEQRVFMKYVYDDGTLGTMYWTFVNGDGVSIDRMSVEYFGDVDCYLFNVWTEDQPFYTQYDHCLVT